MGGSGNGIHGWVEAAGRGHEEQLELLVDS